MKRDALLLVAMAFTCYLPLETHADTNYVVDVRMSFEDARVLLALLPKLSAAHPDMNPTLENVKEDIRSALRREIVRQLENVTVSTNVPLRALDPQPPKQGRSQNKTNGR